MVFVTGFIWFTRVWGVGLRGSGLGCKYGVGVFRVFRAQCAMVDRVLYLSINTVEDFLARLQKLLDCRDLLQGFELSNQKSLTTCTNATWFVECPDRPRVRTVHVLRKAIGDH